MSGKTEKNLNTAFVGEAKACLRLLAYAEQAEREGYGQMAKLFRAVSAAERVHALGHLRLMKLVGTTEENLQASFERETSISENTYPQFLREAEEEGQQAAALGFSHARDAESFHAKLYKNALAHLMEETGADYFVCQVCGYLAEGQAPEACPVCGAGAKQFLEVS